MRTLAELERDPEFNRHAWNDVESGQYERFYKPQPGDYVLDIGAHVGLFAERASEWVGDKGMVIAVEPHPDNYRKLKEALGGKSNCFLWNRAAVNDDRKMVELWHNDGNSGGHSLFKNDQYSRQLSVPAVNLGKVLLGVPKPFRFVKIDAEGSEGAILESLIPVLEPPVDIAFEAHSHALYSWCMTLLADGGYEILTPVSTVGVCHARKR